MGGVGCNEGKPRERRPELLPEHRLTAVRRILEALQRLVHQQREHPRKQAAQRFVPGVLSEQQVCGVHSAYYRHEYGGKLPHAEPLPCEEVHDDRCEAHQHAVYQYHHAVLEHRVVNEPEHRNVEQALEIPVVAAGGHRLRPVVAVEPCGNRSNRVLVGGEVEHSRDLRHQDVYRKRYDVQRQHKEPVAEEHALLFRSGRCGCFRLRDFVYRVNVGAFCARWTRRALRPLQRSRVFVYIFKFVFACQSYCLLNVLKAPELVSLRLLPPARLCPRSACISYSRGRSRPLRRRKARLPCRCSRS